jgi:hypothetical protein
LIIGCPIVVAQSTMRTRARHRGISPSDAVGDQPSRRIPRRAAARKTGYLTFARGRWSCPACLIAVIAVACDQTRSLPFAPRITVVTSNVSCTLPRGTSRFCTRLLPANRLGSRAHASGSPQPSRRQSRCSGSPPPRFGAEPLAYRTQVRTTFVMAPKRRERVPHRRADNHAVQVPHHPTIWC